MVELIIHRLREHGKIMPYRDFLIVRDDREGVLRKVETAGFLAEPGWPDGPVYFVVKPMVGD
jgi:hypothetical protein